MRDCLMKLVVVYFIVTSVLIDKCAFSPTLLYGEERDNVLTNPPRNVTHGLWEICYQNGDQLSWSCSSFDWLSRVTGSVSDNRTRGIQALGTLTFLAAVLILISPLFLVFCLCCKVNLKVMPFFLVITYLCMGIFGSITWILLHCSFGDDIYLYTYSSQRAYKTQGYGWGGYVFMTGVGMTSMIIPVILCCCCCSSADNKVSGDSRRVQKSEKNDHRRASFVPY
ncbi:hypothetical protein V1264_005545 [Littorina saxatilis]|uniref:Uncharacterized protein n=1 Tax=Littorina saxatilis TaxID=31220 RepID=A0AAN9G611_9CAEN